MGFGAMAGTTVWIRLCAINGVWNAKEVMLAGDGTQKVALDGAVATQPNLLKAEKRIIPGAELRGKMKAAGSESSVGLRK